MSKGTEGERERER